MRLRLNYVHLVNFRKHEDYTFKPAPEGITAILGENGHGKSSIIDGIAWALYGVKPSKALKNSDLKRNDAADSDACHVEVSLTLNGSDELVVNRSIKGKSATVQCECMLNGKLEAGPAVSNANRWLSKQLGLDENGFLSAVLVQQKQVDDIISQSASIRQSNIEKLTGITAATKALKTAREDANMLRKALSMIAPDAGAKDKYSKIIEDTERRMDELSSKRAALKDKLQGRMQAYDGMKAEYDEAMKAKGESDRMSAELDGCRESYAIICKQRDDALELMTELKGNLPESTDVSIYRKQLDETEGRLRAMQSERAVHEAVASNAPTNGELDGMKSELADFISGKPDVDMDALQAEVSSLNDEIATAKAAKAQALQSLDALRSDGGSLMECPTCLQTIADPSHVIGELDAIVGKADKTIADGAARIVECDASMNAMKTYADRLSALKAALDDAMERSDAGVRALKAIDEMKPEMDALERSVKRLNARIAGVNADMMRIRQYDDAKRTFADAGMKADGLAGRIAALKERLSAMPTTGERGLNAMASRLDAARNGISELKMKAVEMKGDNSLLAERLANAKDALERAEKEEESREKALQRHEVAQASVSVLSGFREHLAQDAVPRITENASDMMARITDGAFVSIDMDEKYNITATTGDGRVMDVHALSGGEQSAVAISLRLAISEMLSGGEPSMLILDEVLTAMDDARSQSILTTIQDAGHGQVIIIAHNDIIRSIADAIVML